MQFVQKLGSTLTQQFTR